MKLFAISTDSTADLKKSELETLGVSVGRLSYTVTKDGELMEYLDDFTTDEEYTAYFTALREGAVAKTSILNLEAHVALFTELAEKGVKKLLHLSQSQGLSPTIDNALKAIEIVKKTYPDLDYQAIETRTTTVGEGILVRIACAKRDQGWTLEDTRDYIDRIKHGLQHFIIPGDLMYLYRGGRLSKASAVMGSAIQIKPIIIVTKEGHLSVWRKEIGLRKAIRKLVRFYDDFTPLAEDFHCVVVHTDAEELALDLAERMQEEYGFRPEVRMMGPIVGAHLGPGSVALCFTTQDERPTTKKE